MTAQASYVYQATQLSSSLRLQHRRDALLRDGKQLRIDFTDLSRYDLDLGELLRLNPTVYLPVVRPHFAEASPRKSCRFNHVGLTFMCALPSAA